MPEAYLATVVTRLGIDRLRSAQMRRETYVGEWLPEPVVTGGLDDPATHAEMSDSLSLAFLVAARAPVARATRRVPAAGGVRLRLRRHRRDRRQERGRVPAAGRAGPPSHRAGPAALRGFAPGAQRAGTPSSSRPRRRATSTGSRHCWPTTWVCTATAAARRGRSRTRCSDAVGWLGRSSSWMRFVNGIEGFSIRPVEVNGHPGALCVDGQQRVLYVMSLDIAEGQIQGIRSIANPDKLRHLGPVPDGRPASNRPSRPAARCPDERVGEPACVLLLGPAELVAEHATDVRAGEGPDGLAGPSGADAQWAAGGDPPRVRLHVLHADSGPSPRTPAPSRARPPTRCGGSRRPAAAASRVRR